MYHLIEKAVKNPLKTLSEKNYNVPLNWKGSKKNLLKTLSEKKL